jgi:hypothetical protein
MEGLTRLVSESLARHGFDRPLDYRHLRWSRWFRCESHHSLLFVPSKPGVFALAEEITHVGTAASAAPRSEASGRGWDHLSEITPEGGSPRRMLAVTQFFEDDDMAFVLDRMLSRQNPMSARLASGRYFVRFVVIEDPTQRRSIASALNQWMVSAAENATGIGSHFATSLELTPATEYVPATDDARQTLFANKFANQDVAQQVQKVELNVARTSPERESNGPPPENAGSTDARVGRTLLSATACAPNIASLRATAPQLDSGAATNIHCPTPFPSGF